jgi:hypothetical protein
MIPSLLEPKPRSLGGLKPWAWLLERIRNLNTEGLGGLLQGVQDYLAPDLQSLTTKIQARYDRAERGTDRLVELVTAALMVGRITAFAAEPFGGKAFEIKRYAWGPVSLPHHDTQRSIEDGIFTIDVSPFPSGALDHKLAKAPVFVEEKQVNDWFKLRPPSGAVLRATANQVIADHKRACPNRPMRRQDFLDAVKARHATASDRRLKALWKELAPDEWKRPGTKRGSRSRRDGQSDR